MSINKLVGIIGYPVAHSLSPNMHNAAFKHLGLNDWRYLSLPVNRFPYIRLKEAVLGMRALSFVGANITVPYKEAVLPYLDKLSDDAKAMASVNTLVIDEQGLLVGHNTDALGFIKALQEEGLEPKLLEVMVLGAGGSAKAIVYGLVTHGCKKITILNRTKTKADDIKRGFGHLSKEIEIKTKTLDKESLKSTPMADLVINCTSLGLLGLEDEMPWDENIRFSKSQIVFDLIYNPKETKLLKYARAHGAKIINGANMLIHQGALAFNIWTGLTAPVEIMTKEIQSWKI